MKLDAFLDELQALIALGKMRPAAPQGVSCQLRLRLRDWDSTMEFCPITAVAFWKTRTYWQSFFVSEAADALGLAYHDLCAITTAADNRDDANTLRRRLEHAMWPGGAP